MGMQAIDKLILHRSLQNKIIAVLGIHTGCGEWGTGNSPWLNTASLFKVPQVTKSCDHPNPPRSQPTAVQSCPFLTCFFDGASPDFSIFCDPDRLRISPVIKSDSYILNGSPLQLSPSSHNLLKAAKEKPGCAINTLLGNFLSEISKFDA